MSRSTTSLAHALTAAAPIRVSEDARVAVDPLPTALRLLDYCRQADWAGHDPYDALNSPLAALPFLNWTYPRLAMIQALKRSPIDVRRLALIPRTQNPKALALFVGALLRLPAEAVPERTALIAALVQRLVDLRSPDEHWCWGYSFPWQTRTTLIPRGAPNLVCTTFVADALLDAYEATRDPRWVIMAADAAKYIATRLYWTDGAVAGFSYPTPSNRVPIHNANLLGAALLCRVSRITGKRSLVAPALQVARYSANRQQPDGSWAYGEAASAGWIDNFHTGYNLCALRSIGQSLGTDEFEPHVRRGYDFFLRHFIREDGATGYFHDRTYPIDIHSVAQSLITLTTLQDLDPRSVPLSQTIFRWAMANMWDARGFFYYRVHRFGTVRTSYMRWSQAWMLTAMARLVDSDSGTPAATKGTV
jgi:hypothetical protein